MVLRESPNGEEPPGTPVVANPAISHSQSVTPVIPSKTPDKKSIEPVENSQAANTEDIPSNDPSPVITQTNDESPEILIQEIASPSPKKSDDKDSSEEKKSSSKK